MGLTDYRRTPAGTGITGWNPGFLVRGITINNVSGSWLQVKTSGLIGNMYVPPYTVGWSKSISPAVQSVDISLSGPSGTIPSIAGDPWEAILSEDPVDNYNGSNFNAGTVSQPLIASGFITPNGSPPPFNLVPNPGVANKHVRTFLWEFSISASLLIAANTPIECAINVVVVDGFGNNMIGNVDTINNHFIMPIPTGYDWHASTNAGNGGLSVSAVYVWPSVVAFQDASVYYNMLYSIV